MNIEFPKDMIKGTFSIPVQKEQLYQRIKLQRILIRNQEVIQISSFTKQQVIHENIALDQIDMYLNNILDTSFMSLELYTQDYKYGYRRTKKGKILTNKVRQQSEFVVLEHNKKKQYLLEEGMIIPPLIDLGIMTPTGKIVKAKFDKYKQINRFLEMIEDEIQAETYLKIIDFGCGKSYLTFILYYYLTFVKKIQCDIIGLDLKKDVIQHCNKIAREYNYDHLHFIEGDISAFKNEEKVDMIVTLHACDTATDFALFHAIQMKCRYIFSVPCCQHEVNLQLKSNSILPISKYGILKERFSAILTDSIRAAILEYYGYKVQALEFVDWDSTPKNILLRAVYSGHKKEESLHLVKEWMKQLGFQQKLYELCFTKIKDA